VLAAGGDDLDELSLYLSSDDRNALLADFR
jgi:hypothetical protein